IVVEAVVGENMHVAERMAVDHAGQLERVGNRQGYRGQRRREAAGVGIDRIEGDGLAVGAEFDLIYRDREAVEALAGGDGRWNAVARHRETGDVGDIESARQLIRRRVCRIDDAELQWWEQLPELHSPEVKRVVIAVAREIPETAEVCELGNGGRSGRRLSDCLPRGRCEDRHIPRAADLNRKCLGWRAAE